MNVRLKTLQRTCQACPSQWEGRTDDGRYFYARYRWGRLTWGFGATIDAAVEASIAMFGESQGGPLDGEMSTSEMLRNTGLVFA